MSLWSRVKDAFAEEVGEAEEKIHHPLWPTGDYTAPVDEGKLYRGSWPSIPKLQKLRKMGINSILNLCSERSDARRVASNSTFDSVWEIPIRDNTAPSSADVARFVQLLKTASLPMYVHCEQGVGRTGCIVAVYRVMVQGWEPMSALKEAESFGLCLGSQRNFILQLKKEK